MSHGGEAGLRARLFGSFEVWANGAPISEWGSRRADQLLKLLLIFRERDFTTDQLVEFLYPGQDPEKVAGNVRAGIADLRRALEPDLARGTDSAFVLSPAKGRYALNAEALDWLDVEAFDDHLDRAQRRADQERWHESLQAYDDALTIYRDDLLIADVDQEWTAELRGRFRERFEDAQERRAECLERLGRFAEAVEALEDLLTQAPSRESAYRALMRCQAQLGNRAQVAQAFADCRAALDEHLATAPSAETEALHARLLEAPPPASEPAVPHNLPTPLTSTVGRERDLQALQSRLKEARLVTLTGVGGAGKTRLALETAWAVLDEYADGVWWVDLLGAGETAGSVGHAVADATAWHVEEGDPSVEERLVAGLGSKRMLLVMENCEHVVQTAAPLVRRLLEACPEVNVLATSREDLGVTGEVIYPVRPLDTPLPETSPNEMTGHSAVGLFVARAEASRPDLSLEEHDLEIVGEICRLLDGLPLAIEMAAAQLRSLPIAELRQRLRDQLQGLHHTRRTVPDRHRSLESVLAWSYAMLSEEEAALFRRLSAFEGRFQLQDVEAVCADDALEAGQIVSALGDLVRKSLVDFTSKVRGGHYRLLQTVRRFSEGLLVQDPDEAAAVDRRHSRHFLRLLADHARDLRQTRTVAVIEAIDEQRANVVKAWRTAVDARAFARLADAVDGLHRWCELRGRYGLAEELIESALAAVDKHRPATPCEAEVVRHLRGKLLARLGHLDDRRGRSDRAVRRLSEALPLAEEADDLDEAAWIHALWASIAHDQGEWDRAQDHLAQGEALYERMEDPWGLAQCRQTQAYWAYREGDFDATERLYREAYQLALEIGDRESMGKCLNNLGVLALTRGNYEAARTRYREALEVDRALDNRRSVAMVLTNLGEIAMELGDYDEAERRFEEGLSLRRQLGLPREIGFSLVFLSALHRERGEYDQAEARLDESLKIGREIDDPIVVSNSLHNLARLRLSQDAPDVACRILEEALRVAEAIEIAPLTLEVLSAVAEAFAKLDRPERAAELIGLIQSHPARHHLTDEAVDALWASLAEADGDASIHAGWARGRRIDLARGVERAQEVLPEGGLSVRTGGAASRR